MLKLANLHPALVDEGVDLGADLITGVCHGVDATVIVFDLFRRVVNGSVRALGRRAFGIESLGMTDESLA